MRRFLNTEDAREKLLRRQLERSVDHFTDQQLEGTAEFQKVKKFVVGGILSIGIFVIITIFVIVSNGISEMEKSVPFLVLEEEPQIVLIGSSYLTEGNNNIAIGYQALQNVKDDEYLNIDP